MLPNCPPGCPQPTVNGNDGFMAEAGGHVFTYDSRIGKWDDLDVGAILKSAAVQGADGTGRRCHDYEGRMRKTVPRRRDVTGRNLSGCVQHK